MKLVLMRHAKAEAPLYQKDFDRNLAPKGRKQVDSILHQFCTYFGEVFYFTVLCSEAHRTAETLSILSKGISIRGQKISKNAYLANSTQLLQLINDYDVESKEKQALLVIGHNNGISDLIYDLTGQSLILKTSEAVLIEFPFQSSAYISQQTGHLIKHFIPDC